MSTVRTERNKTLVLRFCEAKNSGDAEILSKTIDELVEPDALIRTPLPIQATGAKKLKEAFARLHRAYPDLHITVEDVIAEGDKVVNRNSVTGTHQGEYIGLTPTGKSVTYNEIFIFRIAGCRIAETWGVVDVLSQMKQLGAPPPNSLPQLRRPPSQARHQTRNISGKYAKGLEREAVEEHASLRPDGAWL